MSWELYEPTEIGAWRKVVNKFNAANPSIEVSWTGWPFATYDQEVIAQAQAGKVNADVVMCPPECASTLITDYGICEPIGDIATEVGLIPDSQHKQYTIDGKLYALGLLVVAFILEYDKRILASGGFSAPPTTTEEWLTMTEKLTVPSKQQYGTYLINTAAAAADMWNGLQNFCLINGGVWADGKTLTIDSKENIAGIEYWVQLVKASGLAGTSEDVLTKLWDNDQIATFLNVGLGASSLKSEAPKLYPNLHTAPPPWPSKKSISRLHVEVIPKTTQHLAAAQELAKWLITPENLWAVNTANGYPLIPYSNFAAKIPQYTAFEKALPYYAGFTGSNFVGEVDILGDYVYAYAQLGDLICTNIVKAISGSSTVEECLQTAQSTAKSELHPPT
jgi:ABC-type glycerol-3-phosphate transport system substrate-binding protein